MLNVGIDIVSVGRIKVMMLRHSAVKTKLFTEKEIRYADNFKNPYGHYAMRFAAKEAFFKSIGGIKDFSFRSVEIISDGKPHIHLYGKLKDMFDEKLFSISISDEKEFAIAIVINNSLYVLNAASAAYSKV